MKKIIFRILGALASALIIVSVFVPFVSVTGYSQSLWQAHESLGTLYLPIMIIVFGAIGVIFFSINIKTELAYASSGALTFFLVMQTIPIIDQGTFSTLSVGYYFLVIGTVLTGIMAFLSNLRTKQKVVEKQQQEEPKEVSMIDQIDKLYNDQSVTTETSNINALDNVIQPLPVQENVNPIQIQENVEIPQVSIESVQNETQPTVVSNTNMTQGPVSLKDLGSSNDKVEEPIQPVNQQQEPVAIQQQEPVVSEFSAPVESIPNNVSQNIQPQNPVVSEFSAPNNATNPVTAEFSAPVESVPNNISQNIQPQNPVVSEFSAPGNNPVVSEFGLSSTEPVSAPTMDEQPTQVIEPLQPLGSENKVDVMSAPTNNNNSNLDIFG